MHQKFMQRCFELAQQGLGHVAPNPMVGAVIVNHGTIIAEGYHQQYGSKHAERNAIEQLKNTHENYRDLLKQSTLYVNLEPCSHTGKTPPCADLIMEYEIPEVVISTKDPNLLVNGMGIEKLKAAGIHVITGVLEEEGSFLNRRFFTQKTKQRPYIILKWAQSADGYMNEAGSTRTKLTHEKVDQLVHQWRSQENGILIGTKTALIDNPQLNIRWGSGNPPVRIVIDKNLILPSHLHLFDKKQKTVVINYLKDDYQENLIHVKLEQGDYLVPLMMYQLYLMDLQSIIVEGGAYTLQKFIDSGLWDEARIITTSTPLKNGLQAPKLTATKYKEEFIDSTLIEYYLK